MTGKPQKQPPRLATSHPRQGPVRLALAIAPILAIAATAIGLLVLLGYVTHTSWLWRPLAHGPATHPLTAASLVMIGVAAYLNRRRRGRTIALCLAVAVITIGLARLTDPWTGGSIFRMLTPFPSILAENLSAGTPIRMGPNTAASLLLSAIAILFQSKHRIGLAQLAAAAAASLPLIGLTGYLDGIATFYGQMAPPTIISTLAASGGILFATAHRGMLRGILSPWPAGRMARIQIGALTGVYLLLGFVVCRLGLENNLKTFATETIFMSFVIVTVIGASATVYERLDRRRRQAEHDFEQAAMVDFLTGLRNRRSFFAEAEAFWAQERDPRNGVGVLLMDIDHFKSINDRFGHDAGDAVLRWIGALLPQQVRGSDIIGRMGGEEFAILLPGADLPAALRLAEAIRAKLAAKDFRDLVPGLPQVTASIGVTAGLRRREPLRALLSTADAALYRAKDAGRNRVEHP
ncbi:GGDEF domain-containing protein [Acidisoma cellulosilytica]|uniref:diguanylate cyclase n=1 Tax=Acidisoma cellulosilyticum TaxID=2802395 RepID=A0A963Z1Q9_9PROT|nr:GGDEF domain-containing protein [Acidisoma cellulosilyticum]MCB8881218.1 GGDEF domain-containing protein [Acidisoma cellulosilyticum]